MSESNCRIRVLRIIARMNIGGPAIQITNLMQSMPTHQFEQLLVTGFCGANEKDYLDTHGIRTNLKRVKWLGRSFNPISDFFAFVEIRKLIKDFNPDIIHTHTFKAGFIGRLAAISIFHRPVLVHTFHGHLLHGYFGQFGTRLVISLERYFATKTTRLISVGSRVRDELLACGIGILEKYEVIYPGFKINPPQELSRDLFGLAKHDFVCGWFGRITKVKRADRVLEISTLAKSFAELPIKFLIVGDGENRRELENRAIEQNLPITFIGWQSEVVPIMNICDLIICTSDNEGTPISLIEAQLLGKPVLSTDVGSVGEIIIQDKTGFVIDYVAQEFFKKIQLLFLNPQEIEYMSQQASNFAFNHFSLERFIAQHTQLYRDLVGIKPPSSP